MVLKTTKRKLPHWQLENSIYFITFKLRTGFLSMQEKKIVFDHLKAGDCKHYRLDSFVIMPNHVHMIFTLPDNITLPRVMQGIKGVTARKINKIRNRTGSLWQSESYDHIIRNKAEYGNAIQYIEANPYRAGLVKCEDKYPFLYTSKSLSL